MGETTNQIENHIAETRSELNENFTELERKVKNAVDWRSQFEERPGTMLGIALGAGVLLSAILPAPRRRRRSSSSYDAPSYQPASYEPPSGLEVPSVRTEPAKTSVGPPGELRKTLAALESALLVMAVGKATGLIDSLVPGFSKEFSRARYGENDYRNEHVEAGITYPSVGSGARSSGETSPTSYGERSGPGYGESSRPKTSAATGD
jgi:hypothetical protein